MDKYEELVEVLKKLGLGVQEGDFVRRDGSRATLVVLLQDEDKFIDFWMADRRGRRG